MVQVILFIITLLIVVHESVVLVSAEFCRTNSSSCSKGLIVHDPFWIDDGSLGEGCTNYPGFEVKCARDGTPVINISNGLYTVLNIDWSTITVREAAINDQECPQPQHNFSISSTRVLTLASNNTNMTIFYNCSSPPPKINAYEIQCLQKYYNNSTKHSYAFPDNQIPIGFDWYSNCEKNVLTYGSANTNLVQALQQGIYLDYKLPVDCADCEVSGGQCSSNETTGTIICYCSEGTELFEDVCPYARSWSTPADCEDCELSGGRCSSNETTGELICHCPGVTKLYRECPYVHYYSTSTSRRKNVIIGVSAGVGSIIALMILLLVVYRKRIRPFYNSLVSYWRKKTRNPTNVEVFLENCGCLALQRYKYSDVKKMTNSFKETLGEGGYGSVFKGKLRDGRLVAVKLLNEAKGKGEDFINEVATIGRTNHVNVVSLLGFYTEKNKRALVYEYMPNGSLERFIYNEKNSSTSNLLGHEKIYEITLGIARGLEYLHRGCNTRILHLDIKPHNILLDQDFLPKISDFGLAKLCPTRESLVSMVGARGTIGYIAPEVYCRNFGGVSHKSDVYSYGMMVLEMIGGRKNIDATVENMSEIYFPHWLYTRLERHNTVEEIEETNIEVSSELFKDDTMKKMIIVALWCIQPHPGDRPSTSKVVDMLEGNMNELQMPPNPFPDPSSVSSATS